MPVLEGEVEKEVEDELVDLSVEMQMAEQLARVQRDVQHYRGVSVQLGYTTEGKQVS